MGANTQKEQLDILQEEMARHMMMSFSPAKCSIKDRLEEMNFRKIIIPSVDSNYRSEIGSKLKWGVHYKTLIAKANILEFLKRNLLCGFALKI